MKDPQSISFWRTNGDLLPANPLSRVVLWSAGTKWTDVAVEKHEFLSIELADIMFKRHVIAINIGHSFTNEFKKEGRFQCGLRPRGAICLFPSDQPFFQRQKVERGVFGNALLLALDPVFVSRIAEGLELNSDRIELIEQRRDTDPTLQHIAMALRAAVRTGDALDHMYGEGLSTALAAHLLREYGVAARMSKREYGRVTRKKMSRTVEYFYNKPDAYFTVSGIIQAVVMSSD